ncbi:MAG: DNA-directed RNA polymerase subunit omega [Ignavibacteriae bacterium]|nr:MAG: DNA-directed RNA polymerase subunit omega [Ignavibacteriota bacterium]
MSVKPLAMHEFLQQTGNIYEAIIVASKRARQIHDDMKMELTQQLETLKALNATPEPEDDMEVATVNPDQLKISLEFEKSPKPTELAINEVREKKIPYRYKEHVDFFAKDSSKEPSIEE